MFDLKIVHLKDYAVVTSADYLPADTVEEMYPFVLKESLPIILSLSGQNFKRATDVIINGFSVQFRVLSDKTMLATLPSSLANASLTSLTVLTNRATFTNNSLYLFQVGDTFSVESGINKAIAKYIKVLLTTPGTDTFDPTLGGGLLQIPGTSMKAPYAFLTKVAMVLTMVAEDIRSREFNLNIPASEKLQSVDILHIDFARGDPTSLDVKIKINTLGAANVPVALVLGVQGLTKNQVSG